MTITQVENVPAHGPHFYINNAFRRYDESSTRFRVPQIANLIQGHEQAYRAIVKQVVIDNFIPTIQANVNDALQYIVNGTTYTVVLSEGVYTIESLLDSLNTQIKTIDAGFNFDYDYDTHKVSLLVPSGFVFQWQSPANQSSDGGFSQHNYPGRFNRTLFTVGFLDQIGLQYSGPVSVIATNPPQLRPTNTINICISNNISVMSSDPKGYQILVQVPVTSDYGSLLSYTPPNPSSFKLQPYALENIDIFLVDSRGSLINMPSCAQLEIHLLLIPDASSF